MKEFNEEYLEKMRRVVFLRATTRKRAVCSMSSIRPI